GDTSSFVLETYDGAVTEAQLRGPSFSDARYFSLLPPLRALTEFIERYLVFLAGVLSSHGLAIIVFALCVRVVTFPVNRWAAQRQRRFTDASERMDPLIKAVKHSLKGAAQSERILAIYKQHGVNPFSGLAGSVGLFVQIPVLMCVFNVMAESTAFSGVGFLAVEDLAQPDRAVALGFGIPMLGAYLNLLPLILGGCLWLSGRFAGFDGQSTRAGMALSLAMVLFFFSFASGLVLYWIIVTLSRVPEQSIYARETRERD
ncbi:MAG: YidC/Oxa1 family membrane protein insertase, partial [Gammaproteobacteria bacterium]|nr:YidC/Oxa1 family membrane protein insertase [Gammaproteobacteria bacterium]